RRPALHLRRPELLVPPRVFEQGHGRHRRPPRSALAPHHPQHWHGLGVVLEHAFKPTQRRPPAPTATAPQARPMASITLRGIEKRYGDTVVVKKLDLEIASGE